MKKIFLLLLVVVFAYSNTVDEQHPINKRELEVQLIDLNNKISTLNADLEKNNIWIKRYFDHKEYKNLLEEEEAISQEIKNLRRKKNTSKELEELNRKSNILSSKLLLLEKIGENPYDSLITLPEISKAPDVTNPLAIISAFSFISDLAQKKKINEKKLKSLDKTINYLNDKKEALELKSEILKSLEFTPNEIAQNENDIEEISNMLKEFMPSYEIFRTTVSVYNKKSAEIELDLNSKIENETVKIFNISIILAILFAITFVSKLIVKRAVKDTERVYHTNRIINIIAFIIISFTLLFNYINNISYLVTLLGFVSAGIAIAMKDWFMSMIGWFVIVTGGSIKVGDRVRVDKDSNSIIGDVLDITLTRFAIIEDVTLTAFNKNRRAGRIVFIPNNYIFTTMVYNYSFDGMKTVYDGVDIVVTFDSNHKKAVHIAREIVKKYAKGYTDISRKQLNILRTKYNLRNTNVEPRIFTFIDTYGIVISSWYLTNSFATLTLRSTISFEIIDAFRQETDITIAYPTQNIIFKRSNDPNMYDKFDVNIMNNNKPYDEPKWSRDPEGGDFRRSIYS